MSNAMEERDSDINILLLGETGTGKSTFINSFVNYIQYKIFDDALKKPEVCLIPQHFTTYDESRDEEVQVNIGEDENECTLAGQSSTQDPKSYVFPIKSGRSIRIIDTPGIGDTRGLAQDKENLDNILQYLSHFKHLHGICILFKAGNQRMTPAFVFCVKQLLSKLDKSAADNIVFMFTNAGISLRFGESRSIIKKLLEEIEMKPPNIKIPFSNNLFRTENEAFRLLVALKNGVKIPEDMIGDYKPSWKKSAEECVKMVRYIKNLKPHRVQDTLSVNETRRVITLLSRPLSDITKLIQENSTNIMKQKIKIENEEEEFNQLQNKLYSPMIKVRERPLKKPVTVCTSDKCSQIVVLGNITTQEYTRKCHEPCYLKRTSRQVVGSPEISKCFVFKNKKKLCKECGCHFIVHMHCYYKLEKYEDTEEDQTVKDALDKLQSKGEQKKMLLEMLEKKLSQLNKERDFIIKSGAKLAHFLHQNSIVPFNDAYKQYLQMLIENEDDDEMLHTYKQYQKIYENEETILNELKEADISTSTSIQDIRETVDQLFALTINGEQLKSMYESQRIGLKRELNKNTEYIHKEIVSADLEQDAIEGISTSPREQNKEPEEIRRKITIAKDKFRFANSSYLEKARLTPGMKSIHQIGNVYDMVGISECAIRTAAIYLRVIDKMIYIHEKVARKLQENGEEQIIEVINKTGVVYFVVGEEKIKQLTGRNGVVKKQDNRVLCYFFGIEVCVLNALSEVQRMLLRENLV